jgi:hypothetical protein
MPCETMHLVIADATMGPVDLVRLILDGVQVHLTAVATGIARA